MRQILTGRIRRLRLISMAALTALAFPGAASAQQASPPSSDIVLANPTAPNGSLTDAATREGIRVSDKSDVELNAALAACGNILIVRPADRAATRQCETRANRNSSVFRRMRAQYPVTISQTTINGVPVAIIEPAAGARTMNKGRVLMELHGGGFISGNNLLEAIAIAAVGRIRVISVDYRQAPEQVFPAAIDDAVQVYAALLKRYRSRHIGIYGCSAGALLTSETIARLIRDSRPLPAAIGLFCEGAAYWMEGDSGYQYSKENPEAFQANPYFANVAASDPEAFPIRSPALLHHFPPTMLISGTRDFALSSVVKTHSMLVREGVDANLYVWEGMNHGFFLDPAPPESTEAYQLIARFFETHLGR